ncbi:MAG: DUF1836 domain-containing protein [Oscillibacter sp.]|nr:DUF1836 domain-containing protein [Oscillibacter sp.]
MMDSAQTVIDQMLAYRCPRYDQLPAITLYSDQVTDALNYYLSPLWPGEDHTVTAAMINNYVKQRVIAPPVKKRYDREQLARLYCTCLLKHVFTISEIRSLMEIQTRTYPFPVAYDYFCTELEKALRATFSTRDFSEPSSAAKVTPESELVRSSALSIAHRLFTEKFLHFYDLSE